MNTERVARIGRDLGAAAGLAAAFLMNRFQGAWSKVSEALKSDQKDQNDDGDSGEQATVKAANKVEQALTGDPVPDERKKEASLLVHYGFGTALGMVYAMAGRKWYWMRAG